MIRKPNFVEYGPRGEVKTLFCKVCGQTIASTQMRPVGPLPNAPKMPRFTRHSNYAEIKISFADGSEHVTHGCKKCLTSGLDSNTLYDMFQADMNDIQFAMTKDPDSIRVAKIDTKLEGIV